MAGRRGIRLPTLRLAPIRYRSSHEEALAVLHARFPPVFETPNSLEAQIATSHDVQWTRGERLGGGNFGQVFHEQFRDQDCATHDLAVKHPRMSTGESAHDCLNERAILALLSPHQNIIEYAGARIDEACGKLCIGMRLERTSLAAIVETALHIGEPVPLAVLQHILGGVVLGLAHAETHAIVHRDIKLDNIIIGHDGHIKVADFGCAARLDAGFVRGPQGAIFGKAPERLGLVRAAAGDRFQYGHDEARYDTRSDVWSVGVLALHLASGMVPHPLIQFVDELELCARYFHGLLPPTPTGCDPALADFITTCLQLHVDERPYFTAPSVSALIPALWSHPFVAGGSDPAVIGGWVDMIDTLASLDVPVQPEEAAMLLGPEAQAALVAENLQGDVMGEHAVGAAPVQAPAVAAAAAAMAAGQEQTLQQFAATLDPQAALALQDMAQGVAMANGMVDSEQW